MGLKLRNSVKEYITVNTLRCNTFIEKSCKMSVIRRLSPSKKGEGVD